MQGKRTTVLKNLPQNLKAWNRKLYANRAGSTTHSGTNIENPCSLHICGYIQWFTQSDIETIQTECISCIPMHEKLSPKTQQQQLYDIYFANYTVNLKPSAT